MFQLLAGAAIGGGNALFASPSDGKDQASQNHVAWVTEVLKRMQAILPGIGVPGSFCTSEEETNWNKRSSIWHEGRNIQQSRS
jgi:hypothetical protein